MNYVDPKFELWNTLLQLYQFELLQGRQTHHYRGAFDRLSLVIVRCWNRRNSKLPPMLALRAGLHRRPHFWTVTLNKSHHITTQNLDHLETNYTEPTRFFKYTNNLPEILNPAQRRHKGGRGQSSWNVHFTKNFPRQTTPQRIFHTTTLPRTRSKPGNFHKPTSK